ncbi:MAG TPA: pilus assembly protein N-terminal domain-containing protein [Acidobacteriota bacterium]|nr:pilus assembly protein N-terminal domain-containing protein [Acidobacteriota bacterium]
MKFVTRTLLVLLILLMPWGSLAPLLAQPQEAPAPRRGERLRVLVGKSLVLNSPRILRRVAISDPEIALASVLSTRQVLINGLKPGSVTLLLWDQNEEAVAYDLDVELNVPEARELLDRLFPSEEVELRQSASSLVLSGTVSSEAVAEQMASLTQTFSPQVVNLVAIREKDETVLLQVRFAEVNRAALQQFGLRIISTGGANTIGTIGTQQFNSPVGNVGALPAEVEQSGSLDAPSIISGGIGNPLKGSPGSFGLTDLLNIFIFRPDINLGATIRALQQKNLLQILAEPNILARNGQEASFLAGGEFPFPVVQAGTSGNAVTIVFKEFGVRLKFTPDLRSDGSIKLKVTPEVSALDFANALNISGFLIPALSTRRADTEVVLRDGQSFAIAGLIDDRLVKIASKVPVLGDIPILGKLFRSHSIDRSRTELLVLVTPRIVQPNPPGVVPGTPVFPEEFLDIQKFDDKKKGEK